MSRLTPEQFEPALAAAAQAYPPNNPHGVFGVAIRRRRTRGRKQRAWTVGLFVTRKRADPDVPVSPIQFRQGDRLFEIAPDVVATGRELATGAGHLAHFSGLHAGAALQVATGQRCVGGITCLLGQGNAPTHLITAGHLFPRAAVGAPVEAALGLRARRHTVGELTLNLLDSEASIDAALVTLSDAGVVLALEAGTAPNLPRLQADAFPSAFVDSTWLRVFLPMTGDYVSDLDGSLQPNRFVVQSGCRDNHVVTNVLVTEFAHNLEGNSGTVLMSDDRTGGVSGQAVGIAVAFAGNTSLHEPLDRVLAEIASATGQNFQIWSQI